MKLKPFLLSVALMATAQAGAAVDTPAYTVAGKDTTCQVFIYSPGESAGLHLAYLTDDERWVDVGQLCSSDFGPWGAEKKMYDPCVVKAKDGTWRALWGLNDRSPQFAVAYSEDLVSWRPQDYPIVKEKGVKSPVAYQMNDGSFDIYLKTAQGKRYVHASEDFRTFEEDTEPTSPDEILWQKDTATVDGKKYNGNSFEVSAFHLGYIRSWFKALAEDEQQNNREMPKTPTGKTVEATLTVDRSKQKKISDRLMGIFFEDISRAADGGIWAEMLENGDFEYNGEDHNRQWKATTAWQGTDLTVATDQPLSKNNAHYLLVGATPVYNTGWDNLPVQKETDYRVSFYARNIDGKNKTLEAALVDEMGVPVARAKVKIEKQPKDADANGWKKYEVTLRVSDKVMGSPTGLRFALLPKGENRVGVDLVSMMPADTYKGHGLRKDLAQAIADLKPRFVRFPGGCMSHGDGLGNIYNWKETVGPQQDRKPAFNIWHYHQSRALGFYEFFQWCEDMGAEPLPVLAAGVPCQNSGANADGIAGQQGGIPMKDMPAYIQDLCDLIEWANGDPATNKWAKMRADAGHPAPFNLKMIGIGNEDLISTDFKDRYVMICKAIKKKYPHIEVVGTVGPFHYPSSDYVEGWKIARENRQSIDAVDEHYYERPGWFINHQDYYDKYDRSQAKVYLGEWASRGKDATDNALAEAIYLCSVERNADVVEMASYAPLLSKDGHSNWSPDLIYFTNDKVRLSESYKVQQLFSQHAGDLYIDSSLDLPAEQKRYVGVSVVKDSKTQTTWLKVVNALPDKLKLHVKDAGGQDIEVEGRSYKVVKL